MIVAIWSASSFGRQLCAITFERDVPREAKAAGRKIKQKRVGEQMGEQKSQKAERPHKMGPFSTNMAEAMGFELMDLLQSTVFKTVALNHSATPPFALRAP